MAASGGELVRTGGAGVGQMLGLAYIDFDIICFGVLSDYHSGVYLLSGADKQGAAFLGAVQPVGDRFSGLKGDQ